MEAAIATVVAASIAGPVMWFLRRFDKRSTEQNYVSQQSLNRIEGRLDEVGGQLNGHITWHLGPALMYRTKEETNEPT